jgi:hypothetical protein
MELFFAGAENPTYMRQLDGLGVERIAISFFEWQRRHSSDDLSKHVPATMQVIITPGVAKKEAIDWEAFSTDYIEFCERNVDNALLYDFDAPHCPADIREHVRGQLSILPNVVMFPMATETLDALCSQYERVGINSAMAKSMDANDLRRVPASLHGSNITDPKTLRVGKFVATTSFAWLSGRRYGELWLFARNKLHHYAADNLERAVRAHARDIEHYGVSSADCLANDKAALTAVAVHSLTAMASSLSKRPRDRREVEIVDVSDDRGADKPLADGTAAPGALVAGNGAAPVHERERIMLPVIRVNDQADPPKMTTNEASLRQCDSCYLSSSCPKYLAESACAFNFPVEIRSDEQWEQAAQTLVEMQYERIAFARFGEQVEGAGLSPRVGQEMDRFFKLLESVKTLKAPVHDPRGGVLTRVFGQSKELPSGNEEDGDEEDEWVDGEIIEDEEASEEEWRASQRAGAGFAFQEEG